MDPVWCILGIFSVELLTIRIRGLFSDEPYGPGPDDDEKLTKFNFPGSWWVRPVQRIRRSGVRTEAISPTEFLPEAISHPELLPEAIYPPELLPEAISPTELLPEITKENNQTSLTAKCIWKYRETTDPDPEVTTNIYCKSRNLPNTDKQKYSTNLRQLLG